MNEQAYVDAVGKQWELFSHIPLSDEQGSPLLWHARSREDRQDVDLLVVPGNSAAEVVDAARRTMLVEDDRLCHILDASLLVTDSGPVACIPIERVNVPSLEELLEKGLLRPETARAITGQVAEALEVARRRGVHHQVLAPEHIFVDVPGNLVHVRGTGVFAAALELSDTDSDAAHNDTIALAGLLYEMMTGVIVPEEGVVAPANEATERPLPDELVQLCDAILNGTGPALLTPRTVRGLAASLEPWQSIPVTLEAWDSQDIPGQLTAKVLNTGTRPVATGSVSDAAGAAVLTGGTLVAGSTLAARAADNEETSAIKPLPLTEGEPSEPQRPAADETAVFSPVSQEEPKREEPAVEEPAVAAPEEDPAEPSHEARTNEESGPASQAPVETLSQATDETMLLAPVSSASEEPAFAADLATRAESDPEPPAAPVEQDAAAEEPAPEEAPATEKSPEEAESESADAEAGLDTLLAPREASSFPAPLPVKPKLFADVSDSPADPVIDPGSPRPSEPRILAAPIPVGEGQQARVTPSDNPQVLPTAKLPKVKVANGEQLATAGTIRVPGRSAVDAAPNSSELFKDVVNVAFAADAPQQRNDTARPLLSRWIVLGAALLLVLALILAITTLTSVGRNRAAVPDNPNTTQSAPKQAKQSDEKKPAEKKAEPEKKPEQAPAVKPEISGLSAIGGDLDHADLLDRMLDGDPNKLWPTKYYKREDFGGLSKGQGFVVNLSQKAPVKAVLLRGANRGGHLEIRRVNADGAPGDVLAQGEFNGDGETRLELPPNTDLDRFAVWIDKLPPDPKGFRIKIGSIGVE
ncbi:hypothetical protein KRX56_00670 [Dermabacteraceae bacterium TAE3-ERU27]|nr:hypothetical protein [Dermabacteraceae bacterium TAE3-ERU27]